MVAAATPWAGITKRELICLAALLSLGAIILGRRLGAPSVEFDEGVYLLSADLLARGYDLGRDVFTSQPPLFLTLVDAVSSVVGGSAAALRAFGIALTLAGALAGWAIVRGFAGPWPALAAVALVVLSPGVVDAAAVVSADVPSVALGTLALLAARGARRRAIWAGVAGGLLAVALLVKLLAVPFAVAIVVAAIVDPPGRRAIGWFACGVLAVLGAVALAYASVLGELWRGAVSLHLEARGGVTLPSASIAAQVAVIASAYLGLIAILALGLANRRRSELREWARGRVDLLAVLVVAVLLLAVHRPLLHHHLVIVAWPLAILAASTLDRRPSGRVLAVAVAAALLLVPVAVRGRDTVEGAELSRIEAIAALVREETPPGSVVVSDLPLAALSADRPAATATVDPSYVRVSTGSLSRAAILDASRPASAVVVGRAFAAVPGLERGLDRRFPRTVLVDGARVYLRSHAG